MIDEAFNKASCINRSYDLSSIKTSTADELFHRSKPNLAGVDVGSRYCAFLAKAEHRDHETWAFTCLICKN
ncbi:hypothetical protein Ltuc_1251 [Legionella tucsonensis]|uniref:Uncharacterized protein n=1 Tax=Legionella tucsonensis TaxID=40335 RepID=A0A0W0ZW87_9GAMM|nr:hypothetical protein Ltuc_1251 [Legionella tucsonensis]